MSFIIFRKKLSKIKIEERFLRVEDKKNRLPLFKVSGMEKQKEGRYE